MRDHEKSNLQVIGIDNGEKSHINDVEHVSNKIIKGKFPKLRKDIFIQIQETYGTPSKQDQNRKHLWHIIGKALSTQNNNNNKMSI